MDSRFWFNLGLALTKREIPLAVRTDRAADVGWGRGYRILIDSQDRITHPEGRFVPLTNIDPEAYADAIAKAYKLTRRERQVLNMIRDGKPSYAYRGNKLVTVGGQTVRRSLLDRLGLIGLVTEVSHGNDSEFVAVQPASVRR